MIITQNKLSQNHQYHLIVFSFVETTMKGWFNAFREDGGPTLYSYSNRTPVTGDISLIMIFAIFGTVYLAFLLIFAGIRKEVLHIRMIFCIIPALHAYK